MLETFLLLFIIMHFILWLLGIHTKTPGYILVAMVLCIFTMATAAIAIQKPVVLPDANSTAQFTVKVIRDPFTAIAQFLLFAWYAFTFLIMAWEGETKTPVRRKKVVWAPLEWFER